MIHSIPFKGISHLPDNNSATDGELSLCMNLVNDDGCIRPIEKPTHIATLPEDYMALYVHESPQALYKNLIVYNSNEKSLLFTLWDNLVEKETDGVTWKTIMTDLASQPSVTAIGNTLVITSPSSPVKYAVWKNDTIHSHAGSYKALAQHPPFVPIRFRLQSDYTTDNSQQIYSSEIFSTTGSFSFNPFVMAKLGESGSIASDNLDTFALIPEESSRNSITEDLLSKLNKLIAEFTTDTPDGQGRFIFPFLVRYAIRLYDGTLTQHSSPVLMIPHSHILAELFGTNNSWEKTVANGVYNGIKYNFLGRFHTQPYILLSERDNVDLSEWEDLIKGIDIFISAPIYTYDQSGYIKGWVSHNGTFQNLQLPSSISQVIQEHRISYNYQLLLPYKNKDTIKNEIESCSLFYKVYSIPFNSINKNTGLLPIYIKDSTLASLTSQEVMTDDFNSHHNIIAKNAFIYNNRLTLADIKEEITADIDISSMIVSHQLSLDEMEYPEVNPSSYKVCKAIGISLTLNNRLQNIARYDNIKYYSLPRYLYFPHPNATKIKWVYKDNEDETELPFTDLYDFPLTPHPGLNGAVYFRGFDEDDMPDEADYFGVYFEKAVAIYPNKIYTSEVDNPFVFKPANINTLNCGVIKNICSVTQALSQGQFGQFPLYAFTDDGIWALEISATGAFSTIQPVSRDVIIDRTEPLNIDNAVVFMSAKGLMILQGSNTTLISSNLSNKGDSTIPDLTALSINAVFDKFPIIGNLAYDYSHQRIYLFTPTVAWVYSIKTGMWSQTTTSPNGTYALNSYPDTILVQQEKESQQSLYTLNSDCTLYDSGFLLTRPIKFSATSLRTIRDIITRGVFTPSGIKTVLFASNDMRTFAPIASATGNEIHRISGTPYKAHRLLLMVNNATSETSVSHTSFNVNERYTNKLR